MNIIALAKYVPNPTGLPPEIGPDFRLRREAGDGALDPGDERAIALACRIADQTGGEVTALSMGPERAVSALHRALAIGAARAMLVTDEALAGADTLATASVLAAAINRGPFDLVIAGVESSDGSTGTMPTTLAELLAIPSATFARRLELAGGTVRIERQTPAGYDVIECGLPALVTVTAGVGEPRHLAVRELIQAKRKPIERLALADLGLSLDQVSPTQEVTAIEFGREREAGEIVEDPLAAAVRIVQLLKEAKVA